jgi:hypothetical protein
MRSAAHWPPSHALGSHLPPVLLRVATATATVMVGRSCSHPPCSPTVFSSFVSTFDTIGHDSTNELASASCVRCVESFLIENKFSKAYVVAPDFYGYDFSCVVSRLLLSF